MHHGDHFFMVRLEAHGSLMVMVLTRKHDRRGARTPPHRTKCKGRNSGLRLLQSENLYSYILGGTRFPKRPSIRATP